MSNYQATINQALEQLGLSIERPERLINYIELLLKWNKAYNLTAITDRHEMLVKHIFDSLSIAPHIQGDHVLDIGSGAGLPGIPLAMAYPDKQFTLLDANKKKTRFLIQASHELGLNNITVDDSRIENFKPDNLFDTITARAFSSLEWLAEQSLCLLAPGGQIVAMKGKVQEEINNELKAHFSSVKTHQLHVPGLDADRHVVIIKNQ